MPKVTVIPSKINPLTKMPFNGQIKRRVAGYARVSTDSEEQFSSYEAQVNYYTNFIKSRTDWEFVNVYTDEGISGTNTKKREGFKSMIADALAGKIDLIITKSISRFARNTVDTLVTIRELKAKGVEVYFEKENIYTFDSKGEVLITIMSSLAQEESRSISENITWGQRNSFKNGKVHVAYSTFLGYDKGENGRLKVNSNEAEIIRFIYKLFLLGNSTTAICKILMEAGIKTPGGKDIWRKNTVDSILTNEKYKGDALLQKSFTIDFLQHKVKKNNGEVQQYYVENSHEAIIPKNEWELVQFQMKKRKELGLSFSSKNSLSSKLVCECCGGFYGPKVWHSNDKYRKVIWQCNKKFKEKKHRCDTPTLNEVAIKQMFIKAYNLMMEENTEVIKYTKDLIDELSNFDYLDDLINAQKLEVEIIEEKVSKLVLGNATKVQNQEEYIKNYNSLVERYEEENNKLQELITERENQSTKIIELNAFIKKLETDKEFMTEWDEEIWLYYIEKALVHKDSSITFIFANGKQIRIEAFN